MFEFAYVEKSLFRYAKKHNEAKKEYKYFPTFYWFKKCLQQSYSY